MARAALTLLRMRRPVLAGLAVVLCAHPAARAGGRPPDVLLYDGAAVHPSLVVGDLDPDGAQDLAWRSDGLWIAADLGSLTADPGTDAVPVAALDHDGDGVDNLIVALDDQPGAPLFDHTLGEPLDARWWGSAAPADVDGDGYDDLVDADGVLHGGPAGLTRGPALDGVTVDTFLRAFPVGDLDGDGTEDVAVCAITEHGPTELTSTASLRLHLGADLGPEV